jgi:hypothetical protein
MFTSLLYFIIDEYIEYVDRKEIIELIIIVIIVCIKEDCKFETYVHNWIIVCFHIHGAIRIGVEFRLLIH